MFDLKKLVFLSFPFFSIALDILSEEINCDMEILSDRFTTSTFQINMSNIEISKGPLWIDVISSRNFKGTYVSCKRL